jgi:hypothetical protein
LTWPYHCSLFFSMMSMNSLPQFFSGWTSRLDCCCDRTWPIICLWLPALRFLDSGNQPKRSPWTLWKLKWYFLAFNRHFIPPKGKVISSQAYWPQQIKTGFFKLLSVLWIPYLSFYFTYILLLNV